MAVVDLMEVRTSSDATPFTSAPALKKRPSPVSTVKIVSGCSLRTRRAEIVFSMMLPPNELSALGRLNWAGSDVCARKLRLRWVCVYCDDSDLPFDLELDVRVLVVGHDDGCFCSCWIFLVLGRQSTISIKEGSALYTMIHRNRKKRETWGPRE